MNLCFITCFQISMTFMRDRIPGIRVLKKNLFIFWPYFFSSIDDFIDRTKGAVEL